MASNDLFFDDNEVEDFQNKNPSQPENEFWDRTQNELDQLEKDFPDALIINDTNDMINETNGNPPITTNLFSGSPDDNNSLTNGFEPIGNDDTDENADASSDKDKKYSAISKADHVYKEPEKIRLWREKQQELLKVKDQEEGVKQKEMKEAAKKELEEWEQRYKEQISKAKENNRMHEKQIVDSRDKYVPGKEWEKVASLCDFNPKNSKHTKDVTRLRSIILKLKSSPVVISAANSKHHPKNSSLPNGHLEDGGDDRHDSS